MSYFHADIQSCGYGKQSIIKNVSFSAENGTLLGILGPNGSGKTTLLKTLCGILPHKGSCSLEGCLLEKLSPKELARKCSYIPQKSGITLDISVLDVVLMGFNPWLSLLETPSSQMKEKARQTLAMVGLAERENDNYQNLSEGQKQLCILARTLVADSRLLLLDEPESALDFRLRHQMLTLLRSFVSEKNNALIVTLHDPLLALNYCDRLLLLSQGSVLGTICPQKDSMEKMEPLLEQIYGKISLQRQTNRSGQAFLTMLKEDET